MDPGRFDILTRVLAQQKDRAATRRAALAVLSGSLLGGWLGGPLSSDAKKKKNKNKNKKKRRCLFGQRRCRDRRCHGCCSDGDCGGNVCELGRCSDCPQNQRLCRDGCIPEDNCCADSECSGGRVCVDGTCECKPNQQLCDGTCISASECCGDDCPECSAENCDGCCAGHVCKEGDSPNFCGRDGFICFQCNELEVCAGGFCACQRECCDDFQCEAPNTRCNRRGFCESCIPDGTAPPGGCDIGTVGDCCSGGCGGPGGLCGGGQ